MKSQKLNERRVALHGTPEWFQARQNGVSATAVANASTAAGFQEEVAKAVWPEDSQIPDNEYMKFGRDWEDWIVQNLPAEYGFVGNQWLFRAPDEMWHLATPDGVDPTGNIIAEVKTTGKDWATIPVRYIRQIQWQIYVTDAERCLLGWLLRGMGNFGELVPLWYQPKTLMIERDEVMIAELKAVAKKLQYECVMGIQRREEQERGTIQS
jgi:hypothetical protein